MLCCLQWQTQLVRIVSISSHQFDQAKKLISDRMKDTQGKLKTTETSKSKTVKSDKKRHHLMIEDVDANSGSSKFGSLSHLPITHTHPL